MKFPNCAGRSGECVWTHVAAKTGFAELGFEIVMDKQEQHNVCAHNATKQSAKGQKGLSKAAA